MKLHITKMLPALLLPFAFFMSSCSESTSKAAQNGYVEVTIKRTSSGNSDGYQTYRFDVPANGFNKIYAAKCTADDNANVDQYIIRGLSAETYPFEAIDIHFTPAKETEGESCSAKATVRLAEFHDEELEQTTGFFWTSSAEEHGLNSDNYSVPMAEGGILTFNFQTSEDDGVYEAGYNNNTSNYPLLSVKIAAPVTKY